MAFCWQVLGPIVPLEERVSTNQYKVDDLWICFSMKYFSPDGSLFQNNNEPLQRAAGVTEWFDAYENDVNHMLWPFAVARSQPD